MYKTSGSIFNLFALWITKIKNEEFYLKNLNDTLASYIEYITLIYADISYTSIDYLIISENEIIISIDNFCVRNTMENFSLVNLFPGNRKRTKNETLLSINCLKILINLYQSYNLINKITNNEIINNKKRMITFPKFLI